MHLMLLPPPVTHTQIQHQPCHQHGAHTVGMNRNPEGLCVSMELQTTPYGHANKLRIFGLSQSGSLDVVLHVQKAMQP